MLIVQNRNSPSESRVHRIKNWGAGTPSSLFGQNILRRNVVQRVDFAKHIAAHFEMQMRAG